MSNSIIPARSRLIDWSPVVTKFYVTDITV